MPKRRHKLLTALAAAVLIAAASGLAWTQREALIALVSPSAGDEGRRRPPPLVQVAHAEEGQLRERLSSVGTLIAPEKVMLTTESAGRVAEVRFEDGAQVTRGQVLLVMERRQAQAEVERAQARVAEREAELRRRQELSEQQFVSQGELDTAIAADKDARASLSIARDRLDDRTLEAPFDGTTGRRLISPGALVEPGTPVAELVQTDTLDLLLDVPGTELARIEPDVQVRATTPAYADRSFSGRVTYVGTQVDQATRTLPLEARIDNTNGLLKPGMLMDVELLLGARTLIRVPEAAIVTQGPSQLVYVVNEQGRVERRPVEVVLRRDGWVDIAEGVAAGEPVVTKGLAALRDGMRIRTGTKSKQRDGDAPAPPR